MYNAYANDIFRYLYVHTRDHALAEDLTADTFTKAWANLDSFNFKQPRPWLYTIAKNLLTDHWRKNHATSLEDEEPVSADESIEEQMDQQLTNETIQAAVAKLPSEMKSVVTLRFVLGYSARKTAESLGTTEGNVRVIQYRALKKLKGYLA